MFCHHLWLGSDSEEMREKSRGDEGGRDQEIQLQVHTDAGS